MPKHLVMARLFFVLSLCFGLAVAPTVAMAGSMTLLGVGGPPPSGGEQTVQIDATGFQGPSSNGVTTTTWSLATPINVGSGPNGTSNMVLCAGLELIGAASGTSSSPSLTWDSGGTNQAMILLPTTNHIGNGNAGDIYVFCLLNPTLGAKTFSASWTGTNQAMLGAASFVNVDQTGGATTFPNIQTNTGTGATASVSISTTPTTRKFFAGHVSAGNFATASGTDIGHNNTGTLGSGAANWDAGTATSMSYTTSSAVWASIAVAIKGH